MSGTDFELTCTSLLYSVGQNSITDLATFTLRATFAAFPVT
jgi:hypothetical protein